MALQGVSGVVVCVAGHSYDVAREGYINLLSGGRHPGIMGDSAQMLAARRRFFDGGFYDPLRQQIIEILGQMNTKIIVELGCGEGYYIGGVSEHISSSKCLASDIAKAAVKQAANRYKKGEFAVADSRQKLPLATASVDVILNIFAPRNASEFARILKPDGTLVVVIPGEHHMAQLRKILPLSIQADKSRAVVQTMSLDFQLASAETLTVPMELDRPTLEDLIIMTPNARFLESNEDNRDLSNEGNRDLRHKTNRDWRLADLPIGEVMEVTAEFQILQFNRLPASL